MSKKHETNPNPATDERLMVREKIVKVIEKQIRDNDPPQTRSTLNRLMAEGFERDEVIRYIGCALTAELNAIMESQQPYNAARYIGRLKQLPKLPWED